MIRYYLVPYLFTDEVTHDTLRLAYFAYAKGIRFDSDRDNESRYGLVAAEVTVLQHIEITATPGIIYIGEPGGDVESRTEIIAAGYPVDPGETVDQLVVELQNQMWVAMARTRYHDRLRAIGLDPATRPTKTQEVAAARAGMVKIPPLREFPIVAEARKRK